MSDARYGSVSEGSSLRVRTNLAGRVILPLALLVLALCGCRVQQVTPADVVGDWRTNRSVNNDIVTVDDETLRINANGTFQIVDRRGVLLDRGTWRILNVQDGDYVNFSYVVAPGLRTIMAGDASRDVLRDFGGLRMDISPDDDVWYRKTSK